MPCSATRLILMPSSTASFTTPTASISPATASGADLQIDPKGIDHRPATLPKIYCQQGARQPGDIISDRRATSSRNQRATSSESAHHRHRSPTLPPSPKTATCLRMSVAALYSTHTTGPSILYGPEQPHLFPVQRFPASRQWYLWPVHHHHRCKNDAPNDRHAQEGHADVAQNPSYAFS